MQLNEIHNPQEHASVSLKVILLVFAVILVGVLGYLVWDYQNTPDTTDYSATPTVKQDNNSESSDIVANNSVDCGDDAYAFEITFNNDWNGYKIKKVSPSYALVTCYFTMPTTSNEPTWVVAAEDHAIGYASVFVVSVYTPAQWLASQEEANKPAELGHNANYYWGWAPAQALPQDLQDSNIASKVAGTVATFKIAP